MTEPAAKLLFLQYRDDPDLLQKKLSDARNESRDQLLSRQLILRDFKTTYSANEEAIEKEVSKEVDKEIDEEIRTSYGGSRVSLIQTLAARGITYEKHRQQIHDRIIIGFLRQKNISSEIIVSPHKVESYYQAHKDEFKVEDEVNLRMIVLKNPGPEDSPRRKTHRGNCLAVKGRRHVRGNGDNLFRRLATQSGGRFGLDGSFETQQGLG